MLRCSRNLSFRRLLTFIIIILCIISLNQLRSLLLDLENEEILHHKTVIYNISDPLVITNLIDQFLDTKDYTERDELWLLLVKSWSKSFEIYYTRTKNICSLSTSSLNFIDKYLNQYTKKLLLDNQDFQRHLTGFGLFFHYNPKEIRSETHDILQNIFHSPCTYFELIVLIMQVQFVLFELNIDYFIGQNTLLGAVRHHDIVPWHSMIELNLPLDSKQKFLENIEKNFQLISQEVNDSFINERQIGFIYKILSGNNTWPHIEIYFDQEHSIGHIFPLHLRPFGPLLLHSIQNPFAMVSRQRLNICESLSWDHQLGRKIEIDRQWRMPCEQLHAVYSFVQTRYSWRRGYCEEILKTKRVPFRTLSYFRYACRENLTRQSNSYD